MVKLKSSDDTSSEASAAKSFTAAASTPIKEALLTLSSLSFRLSLLAANSSSLLLLPYKSSLILISSNTGSGNRESKLQIEGGSLVMLSEEERIFS
jgi:hypothetical protein